MERERVNEVAVQQAHLAKRCFEVPFQGDAHQSMLQQLQRLRNSVDEDMHYSVYTAFVQTSCTGKSRAVLEMSELGVYLCYCSLAGRGSSAHPPRTAVLADQLEQTHDEGEMVLYFKAWLRVLISALQSKVGPVEWKDMQLRDDGVAARVRQLWDQLKANPDSVEEIKLVEDPGDDMQTDPVEEPAPLPVEEPGEMLRDIRNLNMLIRELVYIAQLLGDDLQVVFVFDEARGLHLPAGGDTAASLSPFCQVRRALRTLFDHPTFFALMLDTAAKVSNLMARKEDEDSSRAIKIGMQLLPPLYYLPNMMLNVPQPGLSIQTYENPKTWLRYGRPIWAARMKADGTVNYRKLLLFARQKLMGNLVSYADMTQVQAMALLSAAAGVEICPRSYLSQALAASHMSLVLRISHDRSTVFITMPPEPILSEAAAHVLVKPEAQRVALRHLLSACASGYMTGGPRGEFVAKFVLVAAIWSLRRTTRQWFLRRIPVSDFLRELLVNGADDGKTFGTVEGRLPESGFVFFNSFVVVDQAPAVTLLEKCFVGGHVIMYKAENNLPGCDIIIPVWTPSGMTCIVISVKNIRDSGWLEKLSLQKLKCEFTRVKVTSGLPVITITMSLQEPKLACPANWVLWQERTEEEEYTHITCYGLEKNYKFMDQTVKGLLRDILITAPDPLIGATETEARWIRDMLPMRYHPATSLYITR